MARTEDIKLNVDERFIKVIEEHIHVVKESNDLMREYLSTRLEDSGDIENIEGLSAPLRGGSNSKDKRSDDKEKRFIRRLVDSELRRRQAGGGFIHTPEPKRLTPETPEPLVSSYGRNTQVPERGEYTTTSQPHEPNAS